VGHETHHDVGVTLAAIVEVAGNVGYPVLLLLVMAEAGGLPVPGETALIACGVLASQGRLDIAVVIALAATGAIVGDNIGYAIGRHGGRRLLERPGRFERQRRRVLEQGEPFFERHGPKAVFMGRWILGLRVWASWLAGITHMRWPSFLFWNAAGGITWAVTVGLAAYLIGDSAAAIIRDVGAGALVVFVASVTVVLVVRRRAAKARG
jgi:membrane protein DedA with SNARE-associated domain